MTLVANSIRVLLVAATCLAFSGVARGQEADGCNFMNKLSAVQIATATAFRVSISDEISDGCWPNPEASKNVVELALLNNGIDTEDDLMALPPIVTLAGVGYGISEYSCAVYVRFSVSKLVAAVVPFSYDSEGSAPARSVESLTMWEQSSVMTGPKDNFQGRIKQYFEEAAEAFILKYKKSQAEIFSRCPQIKENIDGLSASSN